MEDSYDSRIYSVFSRVLHVHLENISDQTCRGNLEEWDSLGHITLMEALSEEFKIDIPAEKALEISTIHDIKRVIQGLKDGI
jgi:acyl carrier protein